MLPFCSCQRAVIVSCQRARHLWLASQKPSCSIVTNSTAAVLPPTLTGATLNLLGHCISETPSGTDVSTLVEQINYDHLAKVLTRTTCGLAYPCIKYGVVGQRWTGMRRCRAPSRPSAAFCPCQSWAGCTTNMSGFKFPIGTAVRA